MQDICFSPIGFIETPFREKFAVPRQSGIVSAAKGTVILQGDAANPLCVEQLDGFSHLWLIWVFNAVSQGEWQPRVRPPRLGGNKRVGVFSSRSPFRPNPIGLSVVRLESIDVNHGSARLHVSGVDMISGTPIVDIKPYIAYSDAVPQARSGFANEPPQTMLDVVFSELAEEQLSQLENSEDIRRLIIGILEIDPRPAYRRQEKGGEYGIGLYNFDLRCRVEDGKVKVMQLDGL